MIGRDLGLESNSSPRSITFHSALGVNDLARADNALRGIVGKRLTYQTTRGSSAQMDRKPTARGPTKPKAAKKKEKTQRERFIEAARAAGVDETGKEFERQLKRIIRSRPRSPSLKSK